MQGKVSVAIWPLLAAMWALTYVLVYGLERASEISDTDDKNGDTE